MVGECIYPRILIYHPGYHLNSQYEMYGIEEEERRMIYTKRIKYKNGKIEEEITNQEQYNNFIKERWIRTPRKKRIWKIKQEKTKHYIFYD